MNTRLCYYDTSKLESTILYYFVIILLVIIFLIKILSWLCAAYSSNAYQFISTLRVDQNSPSVLIVLGQCWRGTQERIERKAQEYRGMPISERFCDYFAHLQYFCIQRFRVFIKYLKYRNLINHDKKKMGECYNASSM